MKIFGGIIGSACVASIFVYDVFGPASSQQPAASSYDPIASKQ
jgi:hypothetical protein